MKFFYLLVSGLFIVNGMEHNESQKPQPPSAKIAIKAGSDPLSPPLGTAAKKLQPQHRASVYFERNLQNTSLHTAYDSAQIEYWITSNPKGNLNAANILGQTPAHTIPGIEALRYFFTKGGNIDAMDLEGRTALYCAVEQKNIDRLKLLLDCGAAVDKEAANSQSPISIVTTDEVMNLFVAKMSEEQILLMLRKNKGDILPRSVRRKYKLDNNITCLHIEQDVQKLEIYILAGISVEQEDSDGNRPLHKASSPEAVQLLLKYNAKPDVLNNKKQLPYHTIQDYKALKYLIDNGGVFRDQINPLDRIDQKGYTPLHQAVEDNNGKKAKLLLTYKIQKNPRDVNWLTPLEHAKSAAMVTILLDNGVIAKARSVWDESGNTPLHTARNAEVARALIEHPEGIDVDSVNDQGQTPLHVNCMQQNPKEDVIELLLKKGAKINEPDEQGNMPLHYGTCSTKTTTLLCSHGANVNAQNGRLDTPLHLALLPEVITTLIKTGADRSALNVVRDTPFLRWVNILCKKEQEDDRDKIKEAIEYHLENQGFCLSDPNVRKVLWEILSTKPTLPVSPVDAAVEAQVISQEEMQATKEKRKSIGVLSLILPSAVSGSKNNSPVGSPKAGSPKSGSPKSSPKGKESGRKESGSILPFSRMRSGSKEKSEA